MHPLIFISSFVVLNAIKYGSVAIKSQKINNKLVNIKLLNEYDDL